MTAIRNSGTSGFEVNDEFTVAYTISTARMMYIATTAIESGAPTRIRPRESGVRVIRTADSSRSP